MEILLWRALCFNVYGLRFNLKHYNDTILPEVCKSEKTISKFSLKMKDKQEERSRAQCEIGLSRATSCDGDLFLGECRSLIKMHYVCEF